MIAAGRFLAIGWVLLILSLTAVAQSPEPGGEAPLVFHREYAPPALFDRVAQGLIPVKRAEFESLLEAAQSRSSEGVPAAWITEAKFEATEHADAVLGHAELHIEVRSPGPVPLELANLRMSLEHARWQGETGRSAIVGTAEDGKLYVLVEQSGVLTFDWSLPMRRNPWGDATFDLPLPDASRTELAISLPDHRRLDASAGFVQHLPSDAGTENVWTVNLGGVKDVRVRLASVASQGTQPVVLVRENTTCKLLSEEIAVQTQLRLDVHRSPVEQLEVEILGNWLPTEIRQGDHRVSFELVARDAQPTLAVVRFDPPLEGLNRRLSLSGKQPLGPNARFALPRARLRKATWLEGTLTLEHSAEWELLDWNIQHAELAPSSSTLEEPQAGKTPWRLQQADASLAFTAQRPATRVQVASGTTVRIDDDTATARLVADFQARGNNAVFELDGEVDPSWIVDSIEAVPAESLDDWEIASERGRQQLRVKLQDSVQSSRGLRLIVLAHRPAVSQEEFAALQLRPIRWHVADSRGQVAVLVDTRWQAELTGVTTTPLERDSLAAEDAERLQLSEDVSLLVDEDALAGTRVKFGEEPPKFVTHWRSTVEAESQHIVQVAQVRVEPESSLIERFKVLVKPSSSKDCQWRLEGEGPEAVEAKLVRQGAPSLDEEWEIVLRRPRRTPFTLVATAHLPMARQLVVPLYRCVEARQETGQLELLGSVAAHWVVDWQQGLEPVWPAERSPAALAAWKYDPSQAASLVLRQATPHELLQLLTIEQAALHTRVAGHELMHEVTYRVRCSHPQSLPLKLPPQVRFEGAMLHGQNVEVQDTSSEMPGAPQEIAVPLPHLPQSTDLVVRYRAPRNLQWALSAVSPQWPTVPLPIAKRSWHLAVPDLYQALNFSDSGNHSPLNRLWRRCHGPLPGFELAATGPASTRNAPPGCFHLAFENTAAIPARLYLMRSDVLATLGWSLALLGWLLVALLPLSRRQGFALLLLLGSIALALPEAVDPLGRMLLLGTVLGLITRYGRYQRVALPARGAGDAAATHPVAGSALATGVGLTAIALFSTSFAQENPVPPAAIHRVVIKVDDQGREARDYVHMSERFFADLFARARQMSQRGPAYLLLQAEYRAYPRPEATSFDRLDAELTVEVLTAPAVVRLPWSRRDTPLTSNQLRLNGRSQPATWSDDGDALLVSIASAGQHRLEFSTRPADRGDEAATWDLRFPSLPTARLLVDRLDGGADVRVAPSFLKGTASSARAPLEVDLATIGRCSLATRRHEADATEVAAEQLLWARLWPGTALVEGRWRFRAGSGVLDAATVDFGSDLELVSLNANVPAAAQWQSHEGTSSITWTPRDAAKEIVVEAMFLWKNAGPTEAVLPRVEPQAHSVTKRWLAVDTIDSQQRQVLTADNHQRVDVQDFASVWNAETAPAHARRLDLAGPVPLITSPPGELPRYNAATRWEFLSRKAAWKFTAQFATDAKPLRQIRVLIPDQASLESAEIGVAGQFRAVPWISLSSHEVMLLTATPLQPGNTLRLHGSLPLPQSSSSEPSPRTDVMPQVRNAVPLQHEVELWREPAVQIELPALDDRFERQSLNAPAGTPLLPIAALSVGATDDRPLTVQWQAQPNHPRTVAMLVTTLRREGEQWVARLDGYVAVRDGNVAALRLESSPQWRPSAILEGQASLETNDSQQKTHLITLRPVGGISDRFHFACEAVVAGSSLHSVQLPTVRLLGAEATQSYVCLAADADLEWSTSGLQEATLPSSIPLPGENFAIYRAVLPEYAAALNSRVVAMPAPTVIGGEIVIATSSSGYVARLRGVLVPDGRSTLSIRLPEQARFLHATIEDEPVVARLGNRREIEVPLPSGRLPQVVEIAYSGEKTISTPDAATPELTSWKLLQPWTIHPRGAPRNDWQLAPDELLTALQPLARDSVAAEARGTRWSRRWLIRVQGAQQQLASTEEANPVRAGLAAMEEQLRNLAPAGEPVVAPAPQSPVRAVPVRSAASLASQVATWLAPCLAWLGVLGVGSRLTRHTPFLEWARRWPYLCAVLAAGLIAVLIDPYWLGAGLMLIAAAGSLTWPWRPLPRS
jgi:hypothetical protein